MFFVLSKVFWMLAQPLSLSLLLIVAGLLLVGFNRRRWGLGLAIAGTLVLGLCAFTTVGALLIQPLEARFPRPAPPSEVAVIIVLGGSTDNDVSAARGVTELAQGADRLTEALRLAQLYPQARILLSGGIGALDGGGEPEAISAARLLEQSGIARERLILEPNSRNTDENAIFSKQVLADYPGTALLVTSAFHMPRSMGLFRKQGIVVIAWPTDYRSTGTQGFGIDLEPVPNLERTTVALREWIGLVAYRLTVRIDAIFPN